MRGELTAQQEASTLEVGFDLLQSVQSANDLFPFPFQSGLLPALLQFKEPVQHSQIDGSFDIKLIVASL